MDIQYDPIENTEEFKSIVDEVDRKAEMFVDRSITYGRCHFVWIEKKRILKEEYGIDWKTPEEMNPTWDFI